MWRSLLVIDHALFYVVDRYFLVQKAKEARTVGIVVGTLGVG